MLENKVLEFNWGRDGLPVTCQFLKENGINWKTVIPSIRFGIVKSRSRLELEYWLQFLLEYQDYTHSNRVNFG